jgi:chromosome segregation ATPase
LTSKSSKSSATPVKTIAPASTKPEPVDFNTILLEYGRSIIKSALDHLPEESQSLKDDIVAAKQVVVDRYDEMQTDLDGWKNRAGNLKSEIIDVRIDNAGLKRKLEAEKNTVENLRKQLKDELEGERKKSAELMENEIAKGKALEAELAKMKQDKKRKRESAVEIWEQVEKTKV